MLRGHGTLKSILGKSAVPAKRRRPSPEDSDDDSRIRKQQGRDVKQASKAFELRSPPLSCASSPVAHAAKGAHKLQVERPCPVCFNSLKDHPDPDGHVGKLSLTMNSMCWSPACAICCDE
jgi:hypothetical protein